VKKPPADVYRPDSSLFFSGAIVLRISSVNASEPAGGSITSRPSSWRNDTLWPSISTRRRLSSSPCRRSGSRSRLPLRSMRSLEETMVLAGSRSNVRSTVRIHQAGAR
jgi:hypothetical protein